MDRGHKFQEAQGGKWEEKDLSVNTFELGVDGGLISQKGRGSLAKLAAERYLLFWALGSGSGG
jgi:hypothetical protein